MDAVLPLLSDHSRAEAFAIAAAGSAADYPPSTDAVVLPLASKASAAAAATPPAPFLSACGSASAISVVVDITTTCGSSFHVHHAVRLPKRACRTDAATGGGGDGRGAVRMRGPLRPRATEAEAGAEERFVRPRATGAEAEAEEGLVPSAGGPGRAPSSKTRATVAATGLDAPERSPPRHITAAVLRASPLRSTGGGALRSLLDKKSSAPASPAQPSPPPRSQSYPLIATFFTNNSDPASINVRAAFFTRLSAQCPALPCLPRYLATFLPPSLHLPATFLCLQISFTQLVSDFNAAFLGSINVYLDELANAGSVGATAVASGTSGTNVQYIPLDSPPPYAQVTNRCRLPRW